MFKGNAFNRIALNKIAFNKLLDQYIFKKIKTLLILILIMKNMANNTMYNVKEQRLQELHVFS